jgi:hypothetical protein
VPRLGIIAPRLGKLVKAAREVEVREIICGPITMILGLRTIMRSLTKFVPGIGEVLGGVTVATMAATTATFVPAIVLVEQTAQLLSDDHSEGTSEHTSGDSSEETSDSISISRHSVFSIVARGAPRLLHADARVPADGAIKAEANPSFCDMPHFRSVTTRPQARLRHARRGHGMLSFSGNSMPSKARLRLTM